VPPEKFRRRDFVGLALCHRPHHGLKAVLAAVKKISEKNKNWGHIQYFPRV
jgi:hypothetical protein